MNSEPSGTDTDIPDGGNAIDVYILCRDERDSLEISGQLAPQGYRVTLFSDSAELIDTLRAGKPNLLICDATGPGHDGYEVCREIKSDSDLWRIPILLITGVSGLGDLLGVLDSNADNFIARPYDPQYLFSLVEMLLSSPVEKPDPEKIRTQFKIHHDDRDYVIMADRRKLLEFLLSSFEIAVDRAGELGQAQTALESLKATLERRVADRTSELGTETARLQMLVNGKIHEIEDAAKAQAALKKEIEGLNSRLDDRERVIATHREENTRLTQDLESTRARLAEAEDTVRTLGTEKDELEQALRGDAESLNRDLGQTRKELEEAKKALSDQTAQRAALEGQLAELTHDHQDAQKTLNASSIEIGQLKSTLAAEKNRAESAEVEVKTILQEKARSEQELRSMVEDITERAKQQSQECLRLADVLEAEKAQRAAADQQCSTLIQEAAKKEAASAAEKSTLVEHHEALQQKYDALTESFGAERQKCASLEAELARITEERDETAGKLQSLQDELRTAVAAGEEERHQRMVAESSAAETTTAKDREVQVLNSEIATLRDELERARSDYTQTRQQLDAAMDMHKGLKDELAAAALAGAQADKLARSAASETEQIREELETERRLHRAAEEKLAEISREKEEIGQRIGASLEQAAVRERELQARIEGLSEALDAERDARVRTENSLSRLTEEKAVAESKLLDAADEKTAARVSGEQAAARERELQEKILGLTDTLDAERDARALAEDHAAGLARQKEVADQRLQAATEDRIAEVTHKNEQIATLEADLRAALERQQVLEKQIKAAAGARAAAGERPAEDKQRDGRFAHLEELVKTALDRQRSLEEQLRETEREGAEKDAAMQALSREVERAVAALDAEKEGRRAAEEAWSEAKDALVALRKKPQIPSSAIEEVPIGEHAIVARAPDLPATIWEGPHALARKGSDLPVPVHGGTPEEDSPHARIRTVEDLFEEPREIGAEELADAARSITDAAKKHDVPDDEEDFSPVRGEGDIQDTAGDETPAEEDAGEEESDIPSGETAGSIPQEAGIPAFSRQQWFDLVKWAHNAGTLSHEERLRIVKLGRLIQKGRKLTGRQEAQLAELMLLAHAKGYRSQE